MRVVDNGEPIIEIKSKQFHSIFKLEQFVFNININLINSNH